MAVIVSRSYTMCTLFYVEFLYSERGFDATAKQEQAATASRQHQENCRVLFCPGTICKSFISYI